jgi:DNA primase
MEAVVDVAGRGVATTKPNEVFPPQAGRTKLDLANYYAAAAQGAPPACYSGPLQRIGILGTSAPSSVN